jgi:glycosyltransferase involved in cell wall biosynthesis
MLKRASRERAARLLMPPRVLHIINNLDRCSVEAWLLQMMAHAQRRGINLGWNFYCAVGESGERDGQARELGAGIVFSPVPIAQKLAFARALRAEVKRGGYDVLHSHHDLVSGLYLTACAGMKLRKIVHVHNPDQSVLTPSPLKQTLLRPALRRTCLLLADRIAANSRHSLDTFLAGRPPHPGRDSVHYLGIDPAPFAQARPDRAQFRRELGLAETTPIMLFAGRMTPEKNPIFAIDVLAALRKHMPEVCGVFAGSGSLEDAVRVRAVELLQEDAVRFLGWRADVPEIMAASDWFILPHPEDPMEGFGIAVVEAQLAGLRLLLSHGIADDPLLPTASFRRLSLNDSPEEWARAAVELWHAPAPSRDAALEALRASPMDMDSALKEMMRLHQ